MLDGLPIAIDANRVPLRVVPSAPDLDFTTASLYDAIESEGNVMARADYDLEARAAAESEAELLGLAPGAPVLFATTVAIGEDGRILDLGHTVYRADRYRFQATLMRRAQREENTNEQSLARRGAAARSGDRHRRLRRHARGIEAQPVLGEQLE
jgi:hypothetical protein